ncbi:hypothetical protein RB195_017081 [Necator americanus]|uniref:Fucosyltransferase n=1 Tax=Necator americanus TaxID=51031 RepID=A0ABR1C5P5_NECAM
MYHSIQETTTLKENRCRYWKLMGLAAVCAALTVLLFSFIALNDSYVTVIYKSGTVPLIVAWTKYFSMKISDELKKTMVNCPYECDILERSDVDETRTPDAYIFHGRDLNASDLPQRYPHQLMVMMLFEAPPNAGRALFEVPPDYFNATLTYQTDSVYRWPYGKFEKRTDDEDSSSIITDEQLRAALPRKKKGPLLLVSHCDTHSLREETIRKMSEVIKITISGECNSYYPAADKEYCPKFNKCEEDLIATHRFYISFENSLCKGYITEKFFKRISQMLVPIVQNREIYNDEEIPPDSFIAVDDFRSIKDLGKHLENLLYNDTEYMKYFKWTKRYRKPYSFISDVGCKLCGDLHAKRRLQINNIRKHYFQNQCCIHFE